MPSSHFRHNSSVVLLLTYVLVLSLFTPFVITGESASSVKSPSPSGPEAPHREGELLLRFRAGVSQRDKDMIIAAQSARRKKQLLGESGIEKLELRAGHDPKTAALELLLNPQVEFAEPNFLILKDDLNPNDARFNEQWALHNTGQNGGQFGSDVNANEAWNTTTGSKATVIAVIDSGIDFTHPDLANNQWTNPAPGSSGDLHGWDFVADGAEIKDEQGHGTAVAGIIAAEGNNSVGITGVMWRASLMSLRVLDNTGTGDIAAAVEAIDYASTHGAQVINLSWGTAGDSVALKDAIARANRRNVVVVCSAGNGGRDLDASPYYPASFALPNLISVAATDNFDQLASWSNWDARNVSVAAPGTNVLTTQMGGGYWHVTGTSAAAPLVTGIAGLLRTFRPVANTRQLVRAISDGARQVASLSGKVSSGGVADAAGALAKMHGLSLPLPAPGRGSGGTGPDGSFSTTPPPTTTGAPGVNLPNLDEIRKVRPQQPKAKTPIESNLICADCDPQSGGGGATYYPSGDPNFSGPRRRPINETGQPGEDLGSRNFNWSKSLLALPGRAGLDLNLALTYNSLVWTKDGSFIKFNADLGSPAPGFRLGLPTLQRRFFNPQTGIYAYMMVTPSGGRVELRQVGTTNMYESQDGSYTQLDASNVNILLVRTTDGTQLTFKPVTINSEYRCTEIKDRNGNYISAVYDMNNGHLQTIEDTLGRTITFVYNANNNLQAIRQTWWIGTHDWATFEYGEVYVAPAFGGGLLVNGPNNNYVTVLTRVNLHDGSYFTFNYNAAFAQVNRINHYASDGHLIAYTSYNVNSSAGQTECPRFTERRDWAENWNNHNEAVTSYSVAADGSWGQQTTPDGVIYKELFEISGWRTGLTSGTETWVNGVRKKWTTITWTQDDTNLTYQKNARPTDTRIDDDGGNHRRTQTIYTSYNLPNPVALPTEVKEYGPGDTTLLRRTTTTYFDGGPAYIERRVLGLLREVIVYDASNQPQSKVWYDYDWANDEYWAPLPQAATHHDASGVATGRGNLCWIGRWDVSDVNNFDKSIRKFIKYNKTGSVIATRDYLGHGPTFSYTDSFSDNINRNTFAFPTTITDADGFNSYAKYNYDFSGITRTEDPKGAVQNIVWDTALRLERMTNQNTGAYTRWVYTGNTFIAAYSTIEAGKGEAFEGTQFDGAGRYRATQVDLPGSTGGYSAVITGYDVMGRPSTRSNPTEITPLWIPAGDDAAGWVWTNQSYDWKGRPLLTTNTDGTTRENSYGGCGCAGGEQTTVRDERGRLKRYTKDVLERLKKVEELNWDTSVYSTTDYAYNARDQITSITQMGQTRSFNYDGHGRLQSRTTPEQGTTTYSYFIDDSVQTITDARNATTTFTYNSRHLVTNITYGVTGSVAATPNVSFGYDSAGNRTSMTDGLGSVDYVYNTISQMTSETRTISGVGSYTLSYGYNLAGQLNSFTNHWGAQVGYNYDKVGRLANVSGSGYAGVSSYISSTSYRAFGLKQMNYSNGRTLSLQYDNRLRVTQWNVPGVMGWNYAYTHFSENTSRVTYAQNLNDATLDRSYDYDNVGRLIEARTGSEARGHLVGQGGSQDGPYAHSYRYDQTGNMWYRVGWGGWFNPWLEQWPNYVNNRLTTNPWTGTAMSYDAAGNLTNDGYQTYTYDATGQQVSASLTGLTQSYDGDRLRVKKVENTVTTYYLRSSVLGGQVVAEISGGIWARGYVYFGGQLLALQYGGVNWVHQDPVTKSQRITNSSGTVISTVDLDPWGGETARSSNQAFQPHRYTSYERDANGGDEAMMRRYTGKWHRFAQPDPYQGSYNLANPQSFNRYAYSQNDPVNLVDPLGLDPGGVLGTLLGGVAGMGPGTSTVTVTISGGFDSIFTTDSHWQLMVIALHELIKGDTGGTVIAPIGNLGDNLQKILGQTTASGTCEEYTTKLLAQAAKMFAGNLPHFNTVMEGYRMISGPNGGGYILKQFVYDTVHGDLFANGADPGSVWLVPNRQYGSMSARQIAEFQADYAWTSLHETLHLGKQGGYSDEQLAAAAYELAGIPLPTTSQTGVSRVLFFSDRFDELLMKHCPKLKRGK